MRFRFVYRLHFVSPLNLFRQAAEGGAEAVGLGFVVVHDGILKQGVKSLDRLDLLVSLRHRHDYSSAATSPLGVVSHFSSCPSKQ